MREFRIHVSKEHYTIYSLVQLIGEDVLVSVWGGTRPHIGAIGMSVPRPSLRDPRKLSATSSIFTYVGHKEDLVVRDISESLSSRLKKNVVVTAGVHWDAMTLKGIETVQYLAQELTERIFLKLARVTAHSNPSEKSSR